MSKHNPTFANVVPSSNAPLSFIDGEYAMSGVDTTDIENGAEYAFKVEK